MENNIKEKRLIMLGILIIGSGFYYADFLDKQKAKSNCELLGGVYYPRTKENIRQPNITCFYSGRFMGDMEVRRQLFVKDLQGK